jgi:hypothetical protein
MGAGIRKEKVKKIWFAVNLFPGNEWSLISLPLAFMLTQFFAFS